MKILKALFKAFPIPFTIVVLLLILIIPWYAPWVVSSLFGAIDAIIFGLTNNIIHVFRAVIAIYQYIAPIVLLAIIAYAYGKTKA